MYTVVSKASEMYPKPHLVRDPTRDDRELYVPFEEIAGEAVQFVGETAETDGIIALSNYRLHITRMPSQLLTQDHQNGTQSCVNLPLSCIESVEPRDLFYIHIYCKDARYYVIQFYDNAICKEWAVRIAAAISPPATVDQIFAYAHSAWAKEAKLEHFLQSNYANGVSGGSIASSDEGYGDDHPVFYRGSNWFKTEVARLRFDLQMAWRISSANKEFKICPSYPPEMLVPKIITDQTLEKVALFRSAKRIPAVVWRHTGNGAVLARCSQPAVGWLGWRSSEDEDLINAIAEACAYDNGVSIDDTDSREFDSDNGSMLNDTSSIKDLSPEVAASRANGDQKKVLIVDARSYAAAVGNRARGGGVEYPEYYPTSEIQFMGLANIHVVRKSFHSLRTICNTSPADQTTWLQSLDNTKWLHHLSGLLRTANLCAKSLHVEGRPVMVHCSDGWDRTPQIVALTELLVDPYYRSLEGFRVLVEKEWLDFGHKMSDRCGLAFCTSDVNERCPVFLQFLDCVYQLLLQFPCDFEFNISYLFKLAQHTYSSLFGTFLFNSLQERLQRQVHTETRSVWDFLESNPFNFYNLLYHPRNEVLWPKYEVRDLLLWQDIYVSEQGRGGPTVTGAANSANGKSTRENRSGCVSSSEDSGANNSRDGSENGDLGSQDIALVREELERLQVNYQKLSPSSPGIPEIEVGESSRPPSAQKSADKVDGIVDSVGCGEESDGENVPVVTLQERGLRGHRPIETSTDTLVPEGDVEERFRVRSPTIVARDSTSQPADVATLAVEIAPSASHLVKPTANKEADDAKLSEKLLAEAIENVERRSRVESKKSTNLSASSKPPSSDFGPSCSRLARPWEVPSAAQEQADLYFKNRFDSDGLPVHQTEPQRRLVAIYFTHKEQVESLQRDLFITRTALSKQKSLNGRSSAKNRCNTETDDELIADALEAGGPALSRGDASGSSTTASEISSTWETVDERETRPTLWVPDHAVSSCTICQSKFWFISRKHHCRHCGNIVCADCSKRKVSCANEHLYHPVRICDSCYGIKVGHIMTMSPREAEPRVGPTEAQKKD